MSGSGFRRFHASVAHCGLLEIMGALLKINSVGAILNASKVSSEG